MPLPFIVFHKSLLRIKIYPTSSCEIKHSKIGMIICSVPITLHYIVTHYSRLDSSIELSSSTCNCVLDFSVKPRPFKLIKFYLGDSRHTI